jgi:hypothetical protein
MGETVTAVCMLGLAMYGCVQLIFRLVRLLLLSPRDCGGMWLVPLAGHREDAEYLVRSLAMRRQADGLPAVYVLDAGLDEETRRLVQSACTQCRAVRLIDRAALSCLLADAVCAEE